LRAEGVETFRGHVNRDFHRAVGGVAAGSAEGASQVESMASSTLSTIFTLLHAKVIPTELRSDRGTGTL
jgi:hypothetical protein